MVHDNANVFGDASVFNAKVCGNAEVCGDVEVCSNAEICGNAELHSNDDYSTIRGLGSAYRTITFFRCNDEKIKVKASAFYGTIEEFRNQVRNKHGNNKPAKECIMFADLMEYHWADNSKVQSMNLFDPEVITEPEGEEYTLKEIPDMDMFD